MASSYWYPLDAELVLASRSPRRAVILEMAGIPFLQDPSSVEETAMEGGPGDVVAHWARAKALDVAPRYHRNPVLGGDTMVAVEDEILGKPAHRREAAEMLHRLSGSWHSVYGGACILWPEQGLDVSVVERTRVLFRTLSEEEIAAYVDTGEPMDKAGAYGIQGRGGAFVASMRGSYSAVVGLPLDITASLLADAGLPVWDYWN